MNIAVIGMDNTGKTFLCESLVKMFTFEGYTCDSIHSPGPKTTEELMSFMDKYLLKNKYNHEVRIFDRFPIIEEAVYGKLLRGGSRFDDEEYNKETLGKIDAFVYCYPGMESILNWQDREQMDGVKENAEAIVDEYSNVIKQLIKEGHKVIEYNYNINCTHDVFESLVK